MKIRPWVFLFVIVVAVAPAILSRAQTSKSLPRESKNLVREREKWFYGQREFPLGHIPAGARLKAIGQMRNLLKNMKAKQSAMAGGTETSAQTASLANATTLSQTNWTLIGPQPIYSGTDLFSGRVTALAFDPRDPTNQTIYLGAAEGGLWATTDGGQNWTPLTDFQPSLAVGSIALDPTTNPTTIYIGTGEGNYNGDGYYGVGVLKSTDGGKTWTRDTTFTSPGPYGGPMIDALAVDPSNNQIMLAAVETTSSTLAGGIWRSTDGGSSWTLVSASDDATGVVFDPSSPGVAYGALGYPNGNANNGLYKSTDDGATWTLVPISGVAQSSYGRITLAIGPPNASGKPGELLVASGQPYSASPAGDMLGLFLTTDGGASWTTLSSAPDFCLGQCFYDMAVSIDPQNPSVLYAGGTANFGGDALTVSTDGGNTWSQDLSAGTGTGYVHTDTHAIAFSPDGTVLAAGTDGGAWTTTNVGITSNISWNNLNNTLAITQFYPGIAIFPGNADSGLGGTQDNGTLTYLGTLEWGQIACGDGGYNAITPSGLTQYVVCSAGQGLWVNNGSGWQWAANGIGSCTTTPSQCYSALFVPPIAMDPENPSTLYFSAQDQNGNAAIYQTIDGASSWQPIFSNLYPPGPAQTIAVAPTNSDVVYAATFYAIWKTANATAGAASVWQEVDAGLPYRFETDIVGDPHSSTTAYVSFSGFSSCSNCDGKGHIYETTDGGASWTNITGDLPDTPVNALVVDPALSNTIYAATDVGVFVTTNGGGNWIPLVTGLPNVAVLGLTLDPTTRTLWAGSHGRSMWALQLPDAPTAVISPTSLTFSSQDIGTSSSPQPVTLSNTGGLALGITSIDASSGFTETNNCGSSLAAGSSCTIEVTFAPNSAGSITGTLAISDGLASSPQTVALSGTGVAVAGVTLSPQTLSFGSQNVGSTSSAQPLTLTNSGSAQLNITSITASGPFSETNNCGSSVQPNANCTINVTFAPTAGGSASGTLTISDDAPSNPQTVALSGTGTTVPAVTLSPTTASFGTINAGSASSVINIQLTDSGSATLNTNSITLTGADPSQFALVAPTSGSPACSLGTSSLNAGSSCFFGVKFQPTTAGTLSASVSVTDNASDSPQRVALSGTGLSTVTLTPTTLGFGNQDVGSTSASQPVTLTNTGGAQLNISSIAASGPFSETNSCGSSVQPSASCTINVSFAPTNGGSASGTLTVSDDAASSPQTVTLNGTGVAVPMVTLTPQALSFSNQNVGSTSATQAVALTNTGGAQLNISSIAASSPFSETNTCGSSVQPKASCTINVSFAPTNAGSASGTLTVSDDAASSPQTVTLSGTGVAVPIITLSPQTLSFSSENVGSTSAAQPVTLTNTGSAQLNISSITDSGPFSETNNCGSSVQPNANCTITVSFAPTTAGSASGMLTITDNAGSSSQQNVTLSGNGEDFTISATPSSASVSAGSSASFTISVGAQGGGSFAGPVSLSCQGLPSLASCSFSPASVTPGTSAAASTLTIATTAPSSLLPHSEPGGGEGLRLLVLWLAILLVLAASAIVSQKKGRRLAFGVVSCAMLLCLVAPTVSCNGGGGSVAAATVKNPGTPAGIYTVTLTGQSGQLQHNAEVSIKVQ